MLRREVKSGQAKNKNGRDLHGVLYDDIVKSRWKVKYWQGGQYKFKYKGHKKLGKIKAKYVILAECKKANLIVREHIKY